MKHSVIKVHGVVHASETFSSTLLGIVYILLRCTFKSVTYKCSNIDLEIYVNLFVFTMCAFVLSTCLHDLFPTSLHLFLIITLS